MALVWVTGSSREARSDLTALLDRGERMQPDLIAAIRA